MDGKSFSFDPVASLKVLSGQNMKQHHGIHRSFFSNALTASSLFSPLVFASWIDSVGAEYGPCLASTMWKLAIVSERNIWNTMLFQETPMEANRASKPPITPIGACSSLYCTKATAMM